MPEFLAPALKDARKMHPNLQQYFQTVSPEHCQAIKNDRERYKKILSSKVFVPTANI
jgi:hypothetical protein